MKMEQKECSEKSAYKFQTPGYHPKESTQHSVHGESLKSRMNMILKVQELVKAEGNIHPFSTFLPA